MLDLTFMFTDWFSNQGNVKWQHQNIVLITFIIVYTYIKYFILDSYYSWINTNYYWHFCQNLLPDKLPGLWSMKTYYPIGSIWFYSPKYF